jgi:hypothetical protein
MQRLPPPHARMYSRQSTNILLPSNRIWRWKYFVMLVVFCGVHILKFRFQISAQVRAQDELQNQSKLTMGHRRNKDVLNVIEIGGLFFRNILII